MEPKKREYSEKTRVEMSKQKLSKCNNLVLLHLHEKGVVPKRNSPLQRVVQSILFREFKIEYFFFEKVKRLANMIREDYGLTISNYELLQLVNKSRIQKGRPVYQAPDYFKELKGTAQGNGNNQLSIDI